MTPASGYIFTLPEPILVKEKNRKQKAAIMTKEKPLRHTVHLLILIGVALLGIITQASLFAQETPRYDFIRFDERYDRLIREAQNQKYAVTEEEIKAPYGVYYALFEKELQFYDEDIALFFNENKELIYFTVSYELKENHSQTVMEKLIQSMGEKLAEKYGPNERETAPYYRVYENTFEIYLYPTGPAPELTRLSMKQLDRYASHQEYYRQEVEKLVNQEIAGTVDKL